MFRITFSPAAREEIKVLRSDISQESSRCVASRYIRKLKTFCQELTIAPHRGETRPGVKSNQRTIGFGGRISIIFHVSGDEELVIVIGIRYGGRELDA